MLPEGAVEESEKTVGLPRQTDVAPKPATGLAMTCTGCEVLLPQLVLQLVERARVLAAKVEFLAASRPTASELRGIVGLPE